MNRRLFLTSSFAAAANVHVAAQSTPVKTKYGVPLVSGPMDSVLLKDYEPQSTLVVPRTTIAKARFPVIDVHSHSNMCQIRSANDVASWIRTMDEVGLETSVVFTDAIGESFDAQAKLFEPFGKRFIVFCALHVADAAAPDYTKRAKRELERCVRAGARGLGELHDKGWGMGADEGTALPRRHRMHLDDARLDAIWEKCAELSIPVNIHIADHPSSWQPLGAHQERTPDFQVFNLYGKDVPSYAELLDRRDRMLAKHPRTTFIAAHLSNQGNDLAALARVLDRYPNLYVDISARDYEIGRQPRFALKFLTDYQERVLFGTDMGREVDIYRGWWRLLETRDEFIPGRQWWRQYGLQVNDPVLQKLYAGNARQILNWG